MPRLRENKEFILNPLLTELSCRMIILKIPFTASEILLKIPLRASITVQPSSSRSRSLSES